MMRTHYLLSAAVRAPSPWVLSPGKRIGIERRCKGYPERGAALSSTTKDLSKARLEAVPGQRDHHGKASASSFYWQSMSRGSATADREVSAAPSESRVAQLTFSTVVEAILCVCINIFMMKRVMGLSARLVTTIVYLKLELGKVGKPLSTVALIIPRIIPNNLRVL